MKFYKENNINPAASCLPLLAQLPVFFALYFVLQGLLEATRRRARPRRGSHIVPNITPRRTRTGRATCCSRSTPAARSLSTLLHVDDDGQDAALHHDGRCRWSSSRVIAHFPAGLVLYWVTTNLWTVGQGLDHAAARAEDAARAARRPEALVADAAAGRRAGNGAERRRSRSRPPAQPKPQPRSSRAASSGRRAAAAGDRERGSSPSRRPARPSARRSGRRCASSSGCTVARQGGRSLPGAVRGRARPARRRLHAGPRASRRSTRRRRRGTGQPSAVDESEPAARVRDAARARAAALGVRCRIEVDEDEPSADRRPATATTSGS